MALGQLIEGKWVSRRAQEDSQGRCLRPSTTFRDRITVDGSSGFKAKSGRAIISTSLGLVLGRSAPRLCGS
jgi:putative glutathione S-transferase